MGTTDIYGNAEEEFENPQLWDSLSDEEYIERFNKKAGKVKIPTKPKLNREALEELRDFSVKCMLKSHLMMEDAILKENYFQATELKAINMVHSNFARRLSNILEGRPMDYGQ